MGQGIWMENCLCNLRINWAGHARSQSVSQEHQPKHCGHLGSKKRPSSASPAHGGCAIPPSASQVGPELVAQAEDLPFPPCQYGAEPFCLPPPGRAAAGRGAWQSGSSRGSCLLGWAVAPGSPPGAQSPAWQTVMTE